MLKLLLIFVLALIAPLEGGGVMIAARQIFLGRGAGATEGVEVYKQILSNTLPTDAEVEMSLPAVRQSAFAYLTTLKSITVHDVTAMNAGYLFQGSSVEEVSFPDAVSNTTFSFYQCAKLKVIRVPKLKTDMSTLCYIGNSSVLTDVYINESTCAEILAIRGFPGMNPSQNSNYANVVFHGSDGNVVYNGSAWVKQTS